MARSRCSPPLPGTETASPRTQISFRGVAPAGLGAVRVTGSRSGRHGGNLRAHSDGTGASFVVSKAFRQGERVTVRSRARTYGFTIGRRPAPLKTRPVELPGVGNGGVQRYATRPDLAPPALLITRREGVRALGRHARALRAGPGTRRGRRGPGGERNHPDRFVRALTRGSPPAIFLTIWPLR